LNNAQNTVERRLPERKPSEPPTVNNYRLLPSCRLLYWNISKPVKAFQEFIMDRGL